MDPVSVCDTEPKENTDQMSPIDPVQRAWSHDASAPKLRLVTLFSHVLMMLLLMTLLLFKSKNFILKIVLGDFPGYLVEKNSPSKQGMCV